MSELHLIVGPVGAGKSTYALELARQHSGVRLNLDEWMADLFSPDRPDSGVIEWYHERTQRCLELIWKLAERMVAAGTNVILEIGLIQKNGRTRFLKKVDASNHRLTIHLLDAERDIRRERVAQRNRQRGDTFSMVVPPHIFELASDMWEAPDEDELRGREVRFVRTDAGVMTEP